VIAGSNISVVQPALLLTFLEQPINRHVVRIDDIADVKNSIFEEVVYEEFPDSRID